ncbi:hypothetical protein EPUS_09364 [Endocarpon pusillum Z07020]|uniref:F-box domain-containing protein n=1 Tax=Endocarpon pusillum (strain Z07020 / HMAS-L-300199) TaxID=1263415 RepID=U1GIN0_ENDPU|nr:uncharacterized protein EPUS_09364 [Endocarpon pusillum Z07020]ERF71998.1 hypothetical protein EPUS_09364 [Endocarpon pusillum Z07020]
MALLDLPLELLNLVLKAVWPDDIENASMTCRLQQTLAIPHVNKHKNLRSQYGCLDLFLRENSSVMPHQSPTTLLHTRNRSILKQHNGFRGLLHASPYLSQQEADEWQKPILHGNEGALCALLLSVLPNLQQLYLWYNLQSDMVYLKGMINRIAKASCGPKMYVNRSKEIPSIKNSTYPHALRKLTTLGLQRQCGLNGTEIGDDYDLLLHFINLPSLSSFIGGIGPESTLRATCAASPQQPEYTSHEIQRRHPYPYLPYGATLTAYVIKVFNQDDAAPWFKRWQNLFRTAPWFPKWQRSWDRAEITQAMSQNLPDHEEGLPGTGGFLGLPDVQDAVVKRLFGPSEKVGAVWPGSGRATGREQRT